MGLIITGMRALLVTVSLLVGYSLGAFAQGPLAPPGAPAPTMKTLDQIEAKLEKRTPISSLPFSISTPGSYYLTANLSVSQGNAITVAADNVSVDLNGFALSGSGAAGSGITVSGSRRHIRISNGSVRGFGGDGLGASSVVLGEISSVISSGNGGIGISAGDTVTVRDRVSRENQGDNFRAGAHAVFSHCSAVLSGSGHGFNATEDCSFSHCVADSNVRGFSVTDGTSFTSCIARRNKDYGIFTEKAAVVSRCTASGQGFSPAGLGFGISKSATVRAPDWNPYCDLQRRRRSAGDKQTASSRATTHL